MGRTNKQLHKERECSESFADCFIPNRRKKEYEWMTTSFFWVNIRHLDFCSFEKERCLCYQWVEWIVHVVVSCATLASQDEVSYEIIREAEVLAWYPDHTLFLQTSRPESSESGLLFLLLRGRNTRWNFIKRSNNCIILPRNCWKIFHTIQCPSPRDNHLPRYSVFAIGRSKLLTPTADPRLPQEMLPRYFQDGIWMACFKFPAWSFSE